MKKIILSIAILLTISAPKFAHAQNSQTYVLDKTIALPGMPDGTICQ